MGSYILGDEIGKGAYGQVYKAIDKRDGRVVAVKEIPLAGIDEASLAGVHLEIDLLGSITTRTSSASWEPSGPRRTST